MIHPTRQHEIEQLQAKFKAKGDLASYWYCCGLWDALEHQAPFYPIRAAERDRKMYGWGFADGLDP